MKKALRPKNRPSVLRKIVIKSKAASPPQLYAHEITEDIIVAHFSSELIEIKLWIPRSSDYCNIFSL